MSISEILSAATSGLSASQAGLRTVSNNVANAGVKGYAREALQPETRVIAGRVSGVAFGEPERIADAFLERNVYRRAGEAAQADALGGYLDRLQASLGAPGAEGSLPERLNAISASATAMTAVRASPQTSAKFLGNVDDALRTLRGLDGDAQRLRGEAGTEIANTVDRANLLLRRIHELNGDVARSDGLGRSAGAQNSRAAALEELSGLLAITVREQKNGTVTIDTAGGAVLLDGRVRQLSNPGPGQDAQGFSAPIEILEGGRVEARLEGASTGGRLGGVLQVRDVDVPRFRDELSALFSGLAESLNRASNAGSAVPPPQRLEGRSTGLVGSDRLGFTGRATVAVTTAAVDLVRSVSLDLSALATVDDLVGAINSGLAGAGTASFVNGRLTIAAGAGTGVAIGNDPAAPSSRAGVGLSHFFGLNDLVHSPDAALVPAGLGPSDAHGWGAGQSVELMLRDASGRSLGRAMLTGAAGSTMGDILAEANAGPLGAFGSFALDERGRVRFEPSLPGARLAILGDTTDRFGTGRSFSALTGLGADASGLGRAGVRADIVADPTRLPLAKLQPFGTRVLGIADTSGALAFSDALTMTTDLAGVGAVSVERFTTLFVGRLGNEASRAGEARDHAAATLTDAVSRRDGFSGVNVDEELAQMVVLQNSYGAAARVITAASQMYDTLIGMVR